MRSGAFATGTTFVVGRFKYVEQDNHTLTQGERKVVAVIQYDSGRYPGTGSRDPQVFNGENPAQKAVTDGGKACFTCHIPHADDHYLFIYGAQ